MRCVLFLLLIIVPNMLYAQKDSKIDDKIKEQAKLKVGMLCEYISTIADKIKPTETIRSNRMHLKTKHYRFSLVRMIFNLTLL